MRPIKHFEVPHLALFKSAVTRVLAVHLGQSETNATAIDIDHPLMVGADRYCQAFEKNLPVPEPDSDRGDDPEVQAYLASLYHRKAHAQIAGNTKLEADLTAQTARFKFGNPLWQQMFIQYYEYYWQYPWHQGRQPEYRSWQDGTGGSGDLEFGVIPWRLPSNARVAIVGDIGTGTDEAAAVLLGALSFKPDAILHLGDVYFSGTTHETRQRLVGMVRDVMRASGKRVPFFTIPGNHEYFTGGVSYLKALDSGALIDLAIQRQAASYFCLRSEDDGWQFLGLDTGYYGHYMNVAGSAQQATLDRLHIGKIETNNASNPHWPRHHNPYYAYNGDRDLRQKDTTAPVDQVVVRNDEAAWHVDKLQGFKGRSMLLSHHQLYSALDVCGVAQKQTTGSDGKAIADASDLNRLWVNTGLWQQFGASFGDKIAAWLWGHEHNLNIFQRGYRPENWPANPAAAWAAKTLPKGRCAGHSAIPVQQTEAPYAQKYPVAQEPPGLSLGLTDGWYNHGFQIFELGGRGHAAQLRYYQIAAADPTPISMLQETVA